MGIRARKKISSIVTRRKKTFTPADKKDSSYWDKRKKNNDAAKRSREKKRINDLVMEGKQVAIMEENARLKAELRLAKLQCDMLMKDHQPFSAHSCHMITPVLPNIWGYRMWPNVVSSGPTPAWELPFTRTCSLLQSPYLSRMPPDKELMVHCLNAEPTNLSKLNNDPVKGIIVPLQNFIMNKHFCKDDRNCLQESPAYLADPELSCKLKLKKAKSEETKVVDGHDFPVSSIRDTDRKLFSDQTAMTRFPLPQTSAFNSLSTNTGHVLKRNPGITWHDASSLAANAFPETMLWCPITNPSYHSSDHTSLLHPDFSYAGSNPFTNNSLTALAADMTPFKNSDISSSH
ncbi:hypothetical protein NDU88_005102 [Pleurodeles waltl]|uniref:Nuclear factor interleukin-3-regulated protein n=1 Tax=Pleurodeles waltl TaxID=8319 RepID=A0AAV7L3U7_PLEWA|nr:hypothetical protein NDU88_005102 [Pleurodeles waltl]